MEHKSDSEDSEIDPELDVRSEQFNPLRALTSSKTWLPKKDAPVFDNLAVFEANVRRQAEKLNAPDGVGSSKSKRSGDRDAAGPSGNKWFNEELSTIARRFAPHQG